MAVSSEYRSLLLNNENLLLIPQLQRQTKGTESSTCEKFPFYDRNISSFYGVICHLGVGAFHRSHEAVFTHELLIDQMDGLVDNSKRWGIVGIGLRGAPTRDILSQQDYLFSVVGRDETEDPAITVVGSVLDMVMTRDDPDGALAIERIAHPQTRIVSMTLTEKGYNVNLASRELDKTDPGVAHDLGKPNERPESAVGVLAKALKLRHARGNLPLTVLSCDNIPSNGNLARLMVTEFIRAAGDHELLAWVESHCTFPNSMVDRITPATTARRAGSPKNEIDTRSDELRAFLQDSACIDDSWPILAEKYKQWVVEDDFVSGRPQWEARGALMTDDALPYETMKLRLLNAGHSALAYAGYLLGFRYVDCGMGKCGQGKLSESRAKRTGALEVSMSADETRNPIPGFLSIFLDEQIPTVPEVKQIDLGLYKETLMRRFANPNIEDCLIRLAQDGSLKLVATLKESALANAAAGRPVDAFAAVVATWVRFLIGVTEDGEPILVDDPRASELTAAARELLRFPKNGIVTKTGVAMPDDGAVLPFVSPPDSEGSVSDFLRMVFGAELASNPAIKASVHQALNLISAKSTGDLLRSLNASRL